MRQVSVLIVDDEPNAVRGMKLILEQQAGVEISATCHSGDEAIEKIRLLKPDLVLLDIEMPGKSGFDVIAEVGVERMPFVIFVTAYDEFALQAFESYAVDYILKPVDRARLIETVSRVRDRLSELDQVKIQEQLVAILRSAESRSATLPVNQNRLTIKSRGSYIFLPTTDISWIETAGNYVQIHVGEDSHLTRSTMRQVESSLEPKQFVRIHRSMIVNIQHIAKLTPLPSGEVSLMLSDGTELVASRTYRDKLKILFNGPGELSQD